MALTDLVGPAVNAVSNAFNGAFALIQPVGRSIDRIVPDVVIEESHSDESAITFDPVQGGSNVSDHVIDRPPSVEIRGGFSNSSAGYVGYVQEQYQALLKLKASKRPFSLSTGKRAYKSMLIQAIQVVTDQHSEYVLMFRAILVNVNIVRGSSAADPSTTAASSDQANQANPSKTAGTTNAGTIEAKPIDAQSFAGSYGPGSALNPGTDVAAGSIGDTSFGAVGQSLSGLSPPTGGVDVGELVATDPSTGGVVSTVPASPGYNPFAVGAFGGT